MLPLYSLTGPFFSGRLRSDGSRVGNAKTLARMRYVTSIIIHQVRPVVAVTVLWCGQSNVPALTRS